MYPYQFLSIPNREALLKAIKNNAIDGVPIWMDSDTSFAVELVTDFNETDTINAVASTPTHY